MSGLKNRSGRCTKYNANLGNLLNAEFCPGGSNKDNAYIIQVIFTEVAAKKWHFRFGASFTGGALVKFDNEVVSDPNDRPIDWMNKWDDANTMKLNFSKDVTAGKHTITIYAVSA